MFGFRTALFPLAIGTRPLGGDPDCLWSNFGLLVRPRGRRTIEVLTELRQSRRGAY